MTVSGNTVQENIASINEQGYGGGLFLSNSNVELSGNLIVSNNAALNSFSIGWGGGLMVWESDPFILTNNLVVDNGACTAGSGIWLKGTSARATAGQLLHNTIADNHSSGEGVFVSDYTTLAFANTIISSHYSAGIYVTTDSTATMEATLWHNNGLDIAGEGTVISSSNVTGDPAFTNPSAWNYHLSASSAAIDTGVDAGVTSDLDGDPRPSGSGYDIGADEYIQTCLYLPITLNDYP